MENRGRWFRHRLVELIVPGEITVVLTVVFYSLLVGKISFGKILISLASGLGLEAFLPDGWMFIQLWFLTYIIVCYATVPWIQKIDVKRMRPLAFWGMLGGMTVLLQGTGSLLSLRFGFPSLSWGVLLRFYLAYFVFRRYPIESKTCRKVMTALSVVSAALIAGVSFVRYGIAPAGGGGQARRRNCSLFTRRPLREPSCFTGCFRRSTKQGRPRSFSRSPIGIRSRSI
ncbi:MAG: acyltransferase family protein [Clostridia bacterium]|nr:acyltransferase family protein [Clostridia bacterium]